MRSEIPFNNVPYDYRIVLDTFVKNLIQKQHGNIQSVLLTGSYARGDAGSSSDLDLCCLFQEIDHSVLTSVGKVIRSLPIEYSNLEVNAQCLTKIEFECGHFASFISPSVIYLDAVLLYGNYSPQNPTSNEVEITYKKILAEALLSVRHYICVDEPKENLTYHKLSTFILKPIMFALRLERLLNTGIYPLSMKHLLDICSSNYKILVEWFIQKDLLEQALADNHYYVLFSISDLIENLL